MSKMQKPAPQQQPDSATAYALAALTGFSLALTGCEKQAPQPPAKENHPPQATVHVQVAQPSLSPSESVTLHRMFVQIADQSRTDKNAAKLYVALQDPKVRAFFIELRDGSGSFVKNQFDGTNPELGQSIVRVLQHSANVMNRDLPPRILDLQKAAREGHKQLPAATEAARKALAAAQAEESAYNRTNKTWNFGSERQGETRAVHPSKCRVSAAMGAEISARDLEREQNCPPRPRRLFRSRHGGGACHCLRSSGNAP